MIRTEGYILNSKPYKESDAMMWVYLNSGELKHFIYKGYYKPSSKRLGSGLPFHLYEFKYKDKESLITPIEINTLNAYSALQERIDLVSLGQAINSIYLGYHQHLTYKLYEWVISSLNETQNTNLIFCVFLVEVLNNLGLQPYVDGDVVSKGTLVNHFDIQKGGMTLRKHQSFYSKEDLRLIRQLFKANMSNYSIIYNAHIETRLVDLIVDYFEFHTSIKLDGYRLYQELQ